tara:strand:+ start:317 stop:1555 length:1239 start_codon:yes stop_codon:yes gene_type:complete
MDKKYYLKFENKFRGKREQILSRQSNYDGVIRYLLENHQNPNVLDIGSGRGEWLQKCQREGIKGKGIEIDSEMASLSRKYNLDILEGDALELLQQIESKTYSLITSFHLIEHIDYEKIKKIIYECRRILKDNGLLILETPSIDNLIISSRQFYLDPTHINPINPDGIKFLLGQCGFAKAKYYFINGGPLQNSNKFSLTRVFNGVAQDLLVFALPTKGEAVRFFDSSKDWIKDLDIALETIQTSIQFDESARIIENKLIDMETIIKTQESQIADLILRQNKILNSFPVRLFKSIKNIYLTCKLLISKAKYKIRSRSRTAIKKAIKNLLKLIASFFLLFLRFIRAIFSKFRCFRMKKYVNDIINLINSKLKFNTNSKTLIEFQRGKNKKLINHFYSSKGAQRIYNDIIRKKNDE